MRVQQNCQHLFSAATSRMQNNFRVRNSHHCEPRTPELHSVGRKLGVRHAFKLFFADNVLPIAEPKEVEEEIQDVLSLAKVGLRNALLVPYY